MEIAFSQLTRKNGNGRSREDRQVSYLKPTILLVTLLTPASFRQIRVSVNEKFPRNLEARTRSLVPLSSTGSSGAMLSATRP